MESDWELWAVRAPSARNLDSSSPAKNLSVEPETPWPWTSSTASKDSAVVTATTYRESATPSSSTTPFEESAAANASIEAQNHSGWLPDSEARRERTSSRHASKYSPFYVAVRWYVQDGEYVEVGGLLVELVRFIFPQHRALEGRDRPIDFSAERRSSDIGENCETGETLPQVPRSGQQPLVRVGHVQIRSQVSGTVQHLAEIQSADILEFLETISEAALEKGQLLEFVHRFAESSSRIEPGQIIGTVRYCPHTTVYRGLCVNCQKDISTAEYLQLPSVEPEYHSYRGYGHELALAGGSTEEVLGCSERTTDLVGRAVCRTHVPLAYQNQQLIVSLRKAEELAKDNARRLLRERKLSLVLDLDHTLLHATNDPRAQQILHSLVGMLRVVLQHLQKRREWEEALLDRDTHSLEHLFEKLANAAEANGAELQHVFDEKEMSGTESATSVSDELLQALFDRLGIFAFTIGSNSVFSKYSLSGAAPAMNSLAIWNPVQAASTLTRSNHTGTQHGVTEAVTPVYYIKLRPGLRQFLRNVASRFELHIYTMGSRPYADAIASIIDPDKRLFQGRITSRDDFEDGRLNQKNLKHVFPCDDSMVLVVDDREDVWIAQDAASKARHFPNLIKARPYFFFRGLEEAYQRELQSISSAPSNGNDNDEMEATLTTDALSPNIGRGPLEARSTFDLPTGFTGVLLFLQQWFAADRHDRDHLKRLAEILGECHENFFALYDKCIASEGAEGVLAGEEQVSRTLSTEPEPKKASLEYSDSPRGNLLADHMQSETARYGSASETQQENGRLALGRPCRESQTLAILDHAKQSEGFSKGFRLETEWKPAYEGEANVASGNPQISAQRYPEAGGDCAQSLPSESATLEDSMLQRYRLVTGSQAQSGHVSDSAAEQRPHHIDVAGLVWQRPVCASSTLPHGLELKSTEDARTDRLESSGHTDRLLFPTHITHGRNWRSDGARNDDDREYAFLSDSEGITAFSHVRRQSQLMLRDRRFSRSGDVIADQAPEIGVWLDGNCPSSILGTDGGGEFADGNQASSVAAEARSLRVVDSDGVDDENADDDDDDESVAVASPSPAPTVHHFTSLIGMQDDELDPELAKMQDAGSSGQSQTERHGISGSLASPESWESSDRAAQPLKNPDTMVLPGLDYGKSDVLVGGLSLRRSRRLAERRLRTSNEDSGELSTDSRSTTRATLGSTMAVMRSDKKRGAPSVEEDAGTDSMNKSSHQNHSASCTEQCHESKTKRSYAVATNHEAIATSTLPTKRVRNHVFEKTKEQRRSPSPATQLRENLLHRTAALALAERQSGTAAAPQAIEDIHRMPVDGQCLEQHRTARRPRRLLRRHGQLKQTPGSSLVTSTPFPAKAFNPGASAVGPVPVFRNVAWRPPASVKEILGMLRSSVLAGCELCFTGIFPKQVNAVPEHHEFWRIAVRFGAICHQDMVPQVTHLIAEPQRGRDTPKTQLARSMKGVFIVRPEWLLCSAEEMRRANELEFLLDGVCRDFQARPAQLVVERASAGRETSSEAAEFGTAHASIDDSIETFRMKMAKLRADRLQRGCLETIPKHGKVDKDNEKSRLSVCGSLSVTKMEDELIETKMEASQQQSIDEVGRRAVAHGSAHENSVCDLLLERELQDCIDRDSFLEGKQENDV